MWDDLTIKVIKKKPSFLKKVVMKEQASKEDGKIILNNLRGVGRAG